MSNKIFKKRANIAHRRHKAGKFAASARRAGARRSRAPGNRGAVFFEKDSHRARSDRPAAPMGEHCAAIFLSCTSGASPARDSHGTCGGAADNRGDQRKIAARGRQKARNGKFRRGGDENPGGGATFEKFF